MAPEPGGTNVQGNAPVVEDAVEDVVETDEATLTDDAELERTLGLVGGLTIGIGTTIGAGIFVFPRLAGAEVGTAARMSVAAGRATVRTDAPRLPLPAVPADPLRVAVRQGRHQHPGRGHLVAAVLAGHWRRRAVRVREPVRQPLVAGRDDPRRHCIAIADQSRGELLDADPSDVEHPAEVARVLDAEPVVSLAADGDDVDAVAE